MGLPSTEDVVEIKETITEQTKEQNEVKETETKTN
jgi:hypothetical protein